MNKRVKSLPETVSTLRLSYVDADNYVKYVVISEDYVEVFSVNEQEPNRFRYGKSDNVVVVDFEKYNTMMSSVAKVRKKVWELNEQEKIILEDFKDLYKLFFGIEPAPTFIYFDGKGS